jgi:hypothetical protein
MILCKVSFSEKAKRNLNDSGDGPEIMRKFTRGPISSGFVQDSPIAEGNPSDDLNNSQAGSPYHIAFEKLIASVLPDFQIACKASAVKHPQKAKRPKGQNAIRFNH